MYNDELPNDDGFGSVITARCFVKDQNDPYGVGLYEMMRGNTAIYTYINSLNAQQVEAEIFPLLFGPQVQNGTGTYKRGPNIVNPKTPGSNIDVIKTSGNIAAGMDFADKQKRNIEDNTGVNNIVAGTDSESTLGSTVILKEAAFNRLTPPRNSMVMGLKKDAHITISWIKQTYSVDKVFMIDSDDQLAEFAKQNPDYFIESQPVIGDNKERKGYAVAASKNMRLNFDFTPDGQLLEDVDTRVVPARKLFSEMKNHGHESAYIEFDIDPSSMLLPSQEIKKQTFMGILPIIQNQITQIYALRNNDPDCAASQLRTLERTLDIQGEDIFDFINKEDYNEILQKQPSQTQIDMKQKQMELAAKETAMQSMASGEGGAPSGETPAPGQEMTQDGANPLEPQNPNEMPRPQSPMGAASDASVGRVANAKG